MEVRDWCTKQSQLETAKLISNRPTPIMSSSSVVLVKKPRNSLNKIAEQNRSVNNGLKMGLQLLFRCHKCLAFKSVLSMQ